MEYQEFIESKSHKPTDSGVDVAELNPELFPWQSAIVQWALRKGRAAIFADCGMGKTFMQLEWASQVPGDVILLTPLAVGRQTEAEAARFGIDARVSHDGKRSAKVTIINYEKLHLVDSAQFAGVVLDESSILKSFMGQTKQRLVTMFANTPYRLACTATPAPNDHLELGNHSEFLGVLSSHEMIARWFLPDTSTFGTYRLKGHAIEPYWQWVSSWAVCVGKPSDMGYSNEGFDLPALNVEKHMVNVDIVDGRGDMLFRIPDLSATSVHREKRKTAADRAARLAVLVGTEPDEPWIIWCDTDYEADELTAAIPCAVEVRGSDSNGQKEESLTGFSSGAIRVLVTKPSIAGFGLNWQHCARVGFAGPTYSYEQWYQATRRTWRFGQKRDVNVHVAMAYTEVEVWSTLMRKASEHEKMKESMFDAMRKAQMNNDTGAKRYNPGKRAALPSWL